MMPPTLPTIFTHSPVPSPSPRPNLPSLPSPAPNTTSPNVSPSLRHAPSRPLSPDLPTRDALYLFVNFASYMRSPGEGAEGIASHDDFRDTVRLLDYARYWATQASANVHVLHLKYRFQESELPDSNDKPNQTYGSSSRWRKTAPQPFSTLHDPVIKIDYKENGAFEPLFSQAVFSHIAKACRPPPRIIVVSYVQSKVTSNHLASLSAWALSSSPPCYIFSPLETRLREFQPLEQALLHAIPMSMYAWPASSPAAGSATSPKARPPNKIDTFAANKRRYSADNRISPLTASPHSADGRTYPDDPVATLTVLTGDEAKDDSNPDRIPLWALAPGVGVLHGSTSASLGVRISDFSAKNLISQKSKGEIPISMEKIGVRTSPLDPGDLKNAIAVRPPVEHVSRHTATPEPITRPSSRAATAGAGGAGGANNPTHLTPPDPHPPSLAHPTQSWPARPAKVPNWRKGRREVMEDALEEMGVCIADEDDVADSDASNLTGPWRGI